MCPHCGKSDRSPRSGLDHRRLFAIITAAFDNWPEDHHFKPKDAEHLRKWLLVEAGRFDVVTVDKGPLDLLEAFSIAVQVAHRLNGFVRVDPEADKLYVDVPHSMDFRRMSQRDFAPVRKAIEQILCAELGVTVHALERADAA